MNSNTMPISEFLKSKPHLEESANKFLDLHPSMKNRPSLSKYVELFHKTDNTYSFTYLNKFVPCASINLENDLTNPLQNSQHTAKSLPGPKPVFTDHPCFKLSIETLQELVMRRDNQLLYNLGGINGLAQYLRTDLMRGLVTNECEEMYIDHQSHDDIHKEIILDYTLLTRCHVYGTNQLSLPIPPSFLGQCGIKIKQAVMKLKIAILIMFMIIFAVLITQSLGYVREKANLNDPLGSLTEMQNPSLLKDKEKSMEVLALVQAATAMSAILFPTLYDVWYNLQLKKRLHDKYISFEKLVASTVLVTRRLDISSEPVKVSIPVTRLQVGDIVHLNNGDVVPADGVLIHDHYCFVDESSFTGSNYSISKRLNGDQRMLLGSKVIAGTCTFLVTAVGLHTVANSFIQKSRANETTITLLKAKLNTYEWRISRCLFYVMLIFGAVIGVGYVFDLETFIISKMSLGRLMVFWISFVLFALILVPGGLSNLFKTANFYIFLRWQKNKGHVSEQILKFTYESMQKVTTICCGKAGTLTKHEMTVVRGALFNGRIVFSAHEQMQTQMMDSTLFHNARQLIVQSLFINSPEYKSVDESNDTKKSSIERALNKMASALSAPCNPDQKATIKLAVLPFSSERRRMSTIISKHMLYPNDHVFNFHVNGPIDAPIHGQARLLTKGASNIILAASKWMVDEHGQIVALTVERRSWFESRVFEYNTNALTSIGIAFKDIDPPEPDTEIDPNIDLHDMIWVGVVGIENLIHPEIPQTVEDCQNMGMVVRMVTNDTKETACSIATRCGILFYNDGYLVMDATNFLALSESKQKSILPKLRVLAHASEFEKRLFVHKLQDCGESVAFVGDCVKDSLALRAADVALCTEGSKKVKANKLFNNHFLTCNFASLPALVMSGHSVYISVQKYLQFQMTIDLSMITIGVTTFLLLVVFRSSELMKNYSPGFQLFWINFIMNQITSHALACEKPTQEFVKPDKRLESLFTSNMQRMIIGQSIYQATVITLMVYMHKSFFGFFLEQMQQNPNAFPSLAKKIKQASNLGKERVCFEYFNSFVITIVFNTFVWMSVFNIFNCQTLQKDLNVFRDFFHQKYLACALTAIAVIQMFIIEYGGSLFGVVPLNGTAWTISFVLGGSVIPLGVVIKLSPDCIYCKHLLKCHRTHKDEILFASGNEQDTTW